MNVTSHQKVVGVCVCMCEVCACVCGVCKMEHWINWLLARNKYKHLTFLWLHSVLSNL